MYRVDIENKKLIELPATTYSELNLRERFDIQEWIAGTPEILGEPLMIISKEFNVHLVVVLTYLRWIKKEHWS